MDWMLTSGEIRKAKAEAMGVSVAICNIEECDEAIAIAAVGNVMGWMKEDCMEHWQYHGHERQTCSSCYVALRRALNPERSTQER